MTMLKSQINIRQAVPEDRQKLANLIHFEAYVHRHLDWRTPLDWIPFSPYLVYEQRSQIAAALACPPDPPSVAWIRLFAAAENISVERAWQELWTEASEVLQQNKQAKWVAALALWPWFIKILQKQGFEENTYVVMLEWEGRTNLPAQKSSPAAVRTMHFEDLPLVAAVDEAAFGSIWQNTLPNLEIAYSQALIATVAELGGEVVGYQLSTPTPVGGHLARLAVRPEFQGLGIGYHLVRDLLEQFSGRGARKITVNTQKDNPSSLNLYQKTGFRRTGEEYPVFIYALDQ